MKIKLFKFLLTSFFYLIFSSCSSFLKLPEIPTEVMDISDELKYIYKTDQKDRRQNLLRFIFLSEEKMINNKKVIAVSHRDSIRLKRIIEVNKQGLVNTEADKFYAAYIYFHGGGWKMEDDTMYFRIAYELFKDLGENAADKKWKKEGENYTPISYNRWQEELKSFE